MDVIEVLSNHDGSYSRHLGTVKSTHHTTDVIERARPTRHQPYLAKQRSLEVVCEHIHKQLENESAIVAQTLSVWTH